MKYHAIRIDFQVCGSPYVHSFLHSHSQSYRKYKNQACRYHFGKFFTKQPIIAQPLPKEMSNEVKNMILEKRNTILSTVKKYM